MTTTVAGLIMFLLGLTIAVAGIIYRRRADGPEAAPANGGLWNKIVDAVIRWVDELIKGPNPKKQLLILGVLVMIAGVAVMLVPAVA